MPQRGEDVWRAVVQTHFRYSWLRCTVDGNTTMYHVPVLQHEIAQLLSFVRSPKLLIDATLGDAGHALLMLRAFPSAHIVGIDADAVMLRRAAGRFARFMVSNTKQITFVHGWFDDVLNHWAKMNTLCSSGWKRLLRRRPCGQHGGHGQHGQHGPRAEYGRIGLPQQFQRVEPSGRIQQGEGAIPLEQDGRRRAADALGGGTRRQLDSRNALTLRSSRAGCTHAARWVRRAQTTGADFILFDLGISTMHYQLHNLGFSFAEDQPLDMRLDTTAELTAAHIVNRAPVPLLEQLLWHYGNERYYRTIAHEIYQAARRQPIATTAQLVDIVKRAYPQQHTRRGSKQRAGRRSTHGTATHHHIATKTFMALRIAVNDEFGRLMRVLPLAFHKLRQGGLLACITFHSGEDRIVKHFFQFLCGRHGKSVDIVGGSGAAVDMSSNLNGDSYGGKRDSSVDRNDDSYEVIVGGTTTSMAGGATTSMAGGADAGLVSAGLAERNGIVLGRGAADAGTAHSASVGADKRGGAGVDAKRAANIGATRGSGAGFTERGAGAGFAKRGAGAGFAKRGAGAGAMRGADEHGWDGVGAMRAAGATGEYGDANTSATKTACALYITKKPIIPSRDEVIGNRAARSAKLRAVQKIGTLNGEWLPAYSFTTIDVQSLC